MLNTPPGAPRQGLQVVGPSSLPPGAPHMLGLSLQGRITEPQEMPFQSFG